MFGDVLVHAGSFLSVSLQQYSPKKETFREGNQTQQSANLHFYHLVVIPFLGDWVMVLRTPNDVSRLGTWISLILFPLSCGEMKVGGGDLIAAV